MLNNYIPENINNVHSAMDKLRVQTL